MWIVFLGATLGLERGVHIGVDILTNLLPSSVQRWVARINEVLILAFTLIIVAASLPVLDANQLQFSPAMGIQMAHVYLAIPLGMAIMALLVLGKLAGVPTELAKGGVAMLAVIFGVFVVLLAINMPVAFGLGIAAVAGLLSRPLPLNTLVTRMFVGVDSFTLLAIPFFIAAGEIMNACGITKRIVDFSGTLVGHIRGGLAHVTIVANMFFAGISGSATADASAIGSMMIPAMIEDGFDRDYAVAVNASACTMGPIIPPSILMVIYGSIANVSIASLFLGGFVPGVLIGLALMIIAYMLAIRRNYPARPARAGRTCGGPSRRLSWPS